MIDDIAMKGKLLIMLFILQGQMHKEFNINHRGIKMTFYHGVSVLSEYESRHKKL